MYGVRDIRPDKVAIYIRWSTEDQGDGTTLVVQQEGCQHYVLSQGWRVTPSLIFIDDGYSGGRLERPKLNELRLAVKAGEVDCVVVYKLDRLSRSVMDTVNLVLGEWDGRTYLKSAREPVDTTTPMGKQFFYMLVSYAEWERNVIKERTMSGKMRRAKEGKYPGGRIPIGYKAGDQHGLLEVDPEKAKVVQRIFARYLEEVGTYRIAQELNSDGLLSPSGRPWNVVTLLKILRNPIYAGRLQYAKKSRNPRRNRDKSEPYYLTNPEPIDVAGQITPLVSEEVFERTQALLDKRNPFKTGVRALTSEYLLTGLLKCGCGANMVCHRSVRRGKDYAYYLCQIKKLQGRLACNAAIVNMAELDGIIEQELQNLLASEESYRHFVEFRWATVESQLQETGERRKSVAAGLRSLEEQAKRVNKDYRLGMMSITTHQEHRREIDAETGMLHEQLVHLERLERSLAQQLLEKDALVDVFDLAKRWDTIDMAKRKYVLRQMIQEITAVKPVGVKDLRVRVFWKFGRNQPASGGD